MASENIKVIIKAVLDSKQYKTAVKKSEAQTKKSTSMMALGWKKVKNAAKLAAVSIKAAAVSMKAGFARVKAAFLPVSVAILGIGLAVKKLIKTYAVQEQAEKQLEARIRSTAGAAGLSARELKKMASSLQAVTTFGDEAIINAQSLLLTFTKIGKDVFPLATETILNMSQAMGTDLKSSTIQLGKALNDPVKGISALTRVGVQLSDQQIKQIKAFSAVNDIASAQKVILKELETQFGGAARAAAEGTGQMVQFGNIVGDVAELIGGKLARVLIPVFTSMSKFLTDLLSSNRDLITTTSDLTTEYDAYQKALKATADEAEGLTKKQRILNKLQLAQTKSKLFETISRVTSEYEKQIGKINKLEKKARFFQEEELDLAHKIFQAKNLQGKADTDLMEIVLGNGATKIKALIPVAKAEERLAQLKLKNLGIDAKLGVANTELATSVNTLAKAQVLLTDIDLVSTFTNTKLKASVRAVLAEMQAGIKTVKEDTEETDKNTKAKIAAAKAAKIVADALAEEEEERQKLKEAKEHAAALIKLGELLGKKKLDKIKELEEQRIALIKRFQEKEVEINKATDRQIKNEKIKAAAELVAIISNLGQQIADIAGSFIQAAMDRDAMETERKLADLDTRHQAELVAQGVQDQTAVQTAEKRLLDLQALDQSEFDEKEKKAHATQVLESTNAVTRAKIDKKFSDEKIQLEKDGAKAAAIQQRKSAIAEKISALFGIVANTALGIMKAVASFPLTGGMPWAGIITGLGIAQGAAVVAQPLPEVPSFQRGTSNFGGGLARINETGGEMGVFPGGTQFLTNSATKDMLFNQPNQSSVSNTTNETTNNSTTNNISVEARDANDLRNELLRIEGNEAFI